MNLSFDDRGLVPVIVQDVGSGAVLMLAWANQEAVDKTLETGEAHFFSRSRQALWRKGETSGNVLKVVSVSVDCDGDALLVRALPAGPTCHTGARSCFSPNPPLLELGWLAEILAQRKDADPATSYTARLLASGIERVAQKVGEEGVETALAALSAHYRPDDAGRATALAGEAADLLYHLLVLLLAGKLDLAQVTHVLLGRHGFAAAPHS